MTVRMTDHNSRANRNGVHSARHIGRDFDTSLADNIDEGRMLGDKLFVYHDNAPLMLKFCIKNHKVILEDHCGILEHELNCYQQYIGEALAKKNERKVKYRHKDQCKSIEQLYESKNTAPEEQLFYLGGKSEHVDPEILLKAYQRYQDELTKIYGNNIKFLSAALHCDEMGAPHIHFRRIYLGKDRDGIYISQNKALMEMGFKSPHPEKKETKWNNAKIAFSVFERQLKCDICRELGIEVEMQPNTPGKRTQELHECLAELAMERQNRAEERRAVAFEQYKIIKINIADAEKKLDGIRNDTELAQGERQLVKEAINEIEQELDKKATLAKSTIKKLTKPGWFTKKIAEDVPQLSDYECSQVRAYLSRSFCLEKERANLENEKAQLEALIDQRIKDRLPEEYRHAKEDAAYVRQWIAYVGELEEREQRICERELQIDERERNINEAINKRLDEKFKAMLEELNERFILRPLKLIKRILKKVLPDTFLNRAAKAAEEELLAEMQVIMEKQQEIDDQLQI